MENVYLRLGSLSSLPKEVQNNPDMIRKLRQLAANPSKLNMDDLTSMLDTLNPRIITKEMKDTITK